MLLVLSNNASILQESNENGEQFDLEYYVKYTV